MPRPAARGAAGGHETLLLVDDEQLLLEVGRRMLGGASYRVFIAQSGEEALEICRRQGRQLNLVILELSMPDVGSHRCLGHILELTPQARVSVASGYSFEGMAGQALKVGAADFVAKPFTRTDLLEAVRRVLDQRQGSRE
ncbi:hypothetical protein DFAR_3720009 [Desulfarculales bacterium]